ncbi:MAG: MFS transporter [Bacteroidales bacterium]|nr:MFS transporter [Bacteroidales bacterium]
MLKRFIPLRFILVFSTFLLTILLYIDRACISAAKEDITRDLNFDMTDFGWVMAMFTLGYALFQTPSGKLADSRGPRTIITTIVALWSVLTALTGAAWNFVSMMVIRFLFGAGEAGAFPSLAKVVFNWFPVRERGIVQGINFSGSRLGAAFALPLVAWMLTRMGWRWTFVIFGCFGLLFSILWYLLFRNKPEQSKAISAGEKEYILTTRQQPSSSTKASLSFGRIISSRNMWMNMVQYICSNFTFYFTLTWMYPYLKERFALGGIEAGFYAMAPLVGGAMGNWFAGILVDAIYRSGRLKLSRRLPAIIGFILAAFGMIMMSIVDSPQLSIIFLTIAIFGADMTLSPSWAFCIDIGKENTGAVSGTMNMAGNLGAFVTILAFPYLLEWTGKHETFFYVCSSLSVIAIIMWLFMNPDKAIEK